MGNVQHGCKHRWEKDLEELICFYCGVMLYRNRGETSPFWIQARPGDKPAHEKGDRSGRTGAHRRKH